MQKLEKNTQKRSVEIPLEFTLTQPSSSDLEVILNNIEIFKRQSMNIRNMKNVQLFVLKENQKIAGWIGISNGHFPNYSEYFSLFVDPEYRGLGLGLYLELIVVEEAISYGSDILHFRVDSSVAPRLTQSRLNSGCIDYFHPSEEIKILCTKCELFQKECQNQTFMKIDTASRKIQLQQQLTQYQSLFSVSEQRLLMN